MHLHTIALCWGFFLFFFSLQFEDAAKEVADEITRPRPEGEEEVEDIQVMLSSASNACGLRELKVMFGVLFKDACMCLYSYCSLFSGLCYVCLIDLCWGVF